MSFHSQGENIPPTVIFVFLCASRVHSHSFKAVRYQTFWKRLPGTHKLLISKTWLYPQKHYCFKMGGSFFFFKWLIISVMTHNVLYVFMPAVLFCFFFLNIRDPFFLLYKDNDTLQLFCSSICSPCRVRTACGCGQDHTAPGKPLNRYTGMWRPFLWIRSNSFAVLLI